MQLRTRTQHHIPAQRPMQLLLLGAEAAGRDDHRLCGALPPVLAASCAVQDRQGLLSCQAQDKDEHHIPAQRSMQLLLLGAEAAERDEKVVGDPVLLVLNDLIAECSGAVRGSQTVLSASTRAHLLSGRCSCCCWVPKLLGGMTIGSVELCRLCPLPRELAARVPAPAADTLSSAALPG